MNLSRRPASILGACLALGLMIVASTSRADDPPKADAPKIAPEADAVLRRMGDFYAKHRSFRVDDVRTMKVGLLPITQTSTVGFERPNRLAFRPQGFFNTGIEVVSDGRTLTFAMAGRGSYAQVPAPPTVAALAEQQPEAGTMIRVMMDAGDILLALMAEDPHAALRKTIDAATYEGREGDEGTRTHHLRVTTALGRVDVWVDAEGDPLLRRTALNFGKDGEEKGPSFQIGQFFRHWKFDTDEASLFTYQPPPKFRKYDSIFGAMGVDVTERRGEKPSPLIGKPAPALKLGASGGGTFDLAEHRGEVVLLDFWATWCGPCVRELPILTEVATEYRGKGVVFQAVNLREGEDKVEEFQRQKKLFFPVLHDPDGAMAGAYGADAIPTTVLIDREGIVRAVHTGFDPGIKTQLTAELDALLAGRALDQPSPVGVAASPAPVEAPPPAVAPGPPR